MPEYIERSSAAAYFENSKKVMWHKDDVVAAISSSAIPAADVAEVRHGEWTKEGCGILVCSNCGFEYDHAGVPEEGVNYCPQCGAKMDGKGEHNDG